MPMVISDMFNEHIVSGSKLMVEKSRPFSDGGIIEEISGPLTSIVVICE
jgi:hypothetical protein